MDHFRPGFRWNVLGLLCLNLFSPFSPFKWFPPLFFEIKKEIDLPMAQLGMVIGITPLAGLIFAPLGGGLSEKVG